MTVTRRRVAAAVLAATLMGLALFAFSHAGTWLVVQSPLQAAQVAVVFSGRTPFRAMEAARLYKDGWTREIWLTEGIFSDADAALAEMGISRTSEHVYSRQVLERLGVPTEAVRLLAGHNNNTADEVRTVVRAVSEAPPERIILITSSYHSRRVAVLWRALAGDRPQAIVRYTPDDPFDPAHWWRDTADMWAVSREWFGLLNAWAGFPASSEHW